MKKLILLIVAMLTAGTILSQNKVKGNGKNTIITRTTSDYEGIKCSGSFDYILVAGTEGKIKLDGEENLLEYIITEVEEGNLIIKTEDRIYLESSNKNTIKITIPFKDINAVSLAGSGDLWNEDKITSNDLKISMAGSGDVRLTVEASNIAASLAGSGDITLKGNTNHLEASVAGSGEFHGFDLQANHTKVSVAGSGDATVVSIESLKASIAGSGEIKYKGNPKIEDTKVSGSGSISN